MMGKKRIVIMMILSALAGAAICRVITWAFIDKGTISYAQYGEDIIMSNIFNDMQIIKPTYIDIGAADPIKNNNTYYYYIRGSRGVLVEPNPYYCRRLSKVRSGDIVLNCGIGVSETREADYYIVGSGDGTSWNTFSKEVAENAEKFSKGKRKLTKVVKMPLMDINSVLAKYFKKAPDLVSIDVEGWEMPILKSVDFSRFRPVVFCIEGILYGNVDNSNEIIKFMESRNYSLKGRNMLNLIFLDNETLKKFPFKKKL
jgi:FkbM family methyltransferase